MAIRCPLFRKSNISSDNLLEIQPERQLPGPVAALSRCLRRLQNPKGGRAADVAGGRSEVRMIQGVGESRLKPDPRALLNRKDLRQSRGYGYRSRPVQNTHSRIPDTPGIGGFRRKGIDVPQIFAAGRIRIDSG